MMSVTNWFETELKHSKTNQSDISWGRKVLSAIDIDDCVTLSSLFDKRKYPNSNVNTQTTVTGYDGYIWTISIHKFLGDTALHYALKQSKLYCLYMLLMLEADVTIPNQNNEVPSQMIEQIYHQTPSNMKYDAKRKIINHIRVYEFDKLPPSFHCAAIEKEAWRLINDGRILYTELPKALEHQNKTVKQRIQPTTKTRKSLSFNQNSSVAKIIEKQSFMKGMAIDEETPMEFAETTENNENTDNMTQNQTHAGGAEPKSGKKEKKRSEWAKFSTPEGYVYFMNKKTGESTWTRPVEYFDESASEKTSSLESKYSKHRRGQRKKTGNNGSISGSNISGEEGEDGTGQENSLYEDVWTKDNITDIIKLIEKQKRHFYSKILPPNQYSAKGLSLLSSVKFANNPLEETTLKEKQILQEGRSDVLYTHLPNVINLSELEEKTRMFSFIKDISYFQKLTKQVQQVNHMKSSTTTGKNDPSQQQQPPLPSEKTNPINSTFIMNQTNPAMKYNSTVSDKILFENYYSQSMKAQSNAMNNLSPSKARKIRKDFDISASYKLVSDHEMEANNAFPPLASQKSSSSQKGVQTKITNDDQPVAKGGSGTPAFFREITRLSTYTNMKYMAIGDPGVYQLAHVLYNDPIIIQLTLSCARITDEGIYELSAILPYMHKLKYLDLSSNSFTDIGGIELSNVFMNHKTLRVISLVGNRIGLKGICSIASAIVSSHIVLEEINDEESYHEKYGMFDRPGLNESHVKKARERRQKENRIVWCSVKNNAIEGKDRETVIKLFEEYEFDYDYRKKTDAYIFHQKKRKLMQTVQRIIPLPEEEREDEDDQEFTFIQQQDDDEEEEERGDERDPLLQSSLETTSHNESNEKEKKVVFSPHSSITSLPNGSQITGSVESLHKMKEGEGSVEDVGDGKFVGLEGSIERKKKINKEKSLLSNSDKDDEEEDDDDDNIPDELSEMTDLESIDKLDKLWFIV